MDHYSQARYELIKAFIIESFVARLNGTDLDTAVNLTARPDFDWDLLLQIADYEHVSPLLYSILKDRQIAPPPMEEALARKHYYNASRNLYLLHELGQTLKLFRAAGIDTIVLKGAALIETVYKSIALRPLSDLDLLIRRKQLPAALELLAPVKYEQTSVLQRDSYYPVRLEKPGIEPVILELHWSLFHSLHYQEHLSMDWFWQTARTVKTGLQPMTIMGSVGQILHLCGHLVLHHAHGPQLLWQNDLAELLAVYRNEIDWNLLLYKAETFQLILPLRNILLPIAREWGAPMPQKILHRLETMEVSAVETRIHTLNTTKKQSEGQGYWLRLNEITGWRKRLVFVLEWLFPSPASLRSRYRFSQPLLVPLAYLYHMWVGARLGAGALLTRFRKANSSM